MLTNRDERGKCSGAGRLAATASNTSYRYKLVYNGQVPIHTQNVQWNEAKGVKMSWMLDHKGGCRFFFQFSFPLPEQRLPDGKGSCRWL
jgi:hypothetical protein